MKTNTEIFIPRLLGSTPCHCTGYIGYQGSFPGREHDFSCIHIPSDYLLRLHIQSVPKNA